MLLPCSNIVTEDATINGDNSSDTGGGVIAFLNHTIDNPDPVQHQYPELFGVSVSVSGDYAFVGAFQDNAISNRNGAAYIYRVSTGEKLFKLDNPMTNSANGYFGRSIDTDSTIGIVGAHANRNANFVRTGAAYIYDLTTGNLLHSLFNPGGVVNDFFGTSVAISGNYAAVGCSFDDTGSSNAGSVFVFIVSDGGLFRTFNHPVPASGDRFGGRVSMSGDYVVVTAAYYGDNEGRVYIYSIATGTLLHTIPNPSPESNSYFGFNTAIEGDYIVIGSRGYSGILGSEGRAYIYSASSGTLLWTLVNPTPEAKDLFGANVAISGTRVIVSCFTDQVETPSSKSAYIFDTTTGELLSGIDSPSGVAGLGIGIIDLDGNNFVTGNPSFEVAGISGAGRVYFLTLSSGATGEPSDENAIYYHTGDLTINTGVTVAVTGNVQLRIRGHLTINGKLNLKGGGLVASANGQPGFIGSSKATGGIRYDWPNLGYWLIGDVSTSASIVEGSYNEFPAINIINNGGVLSGWPSDLRGTSGSRGGTAQLIKENISRVGGDGGNGGAGLAIVCRGMSFGTSGEIYSSGENGSPGTIAPAGDFPSVRFYSGGGGGCAGGILILLDGTSSVVPITVGHITSNRGAVIDNVEAKNHQISVNKGFGSGELDVVKIAFIPETTITYSIFNCGGGGDAPVMPSIGISPSSIASVAANGPHTTGSVTATPTNITPVTWSWIRVSGSQGITVDSPAAASTTFTSDGDDVIRTTVFRVTATDTNGYSAYKTISVTVFHGYRVTITPDSLNESAPIDVGSAHVTGTVTASQSNMTEPVTWKWKRVNGTTNLSMYNIATSETMKWNSLGYTARTNIATFSVTGTDANGETATEEISVIVVHS